MSILANCRHPGGCFGLLALISAVQPSETPTRPLYPIPFTNTSWTMQCNLISLDCLAMPHTIPIHAPTPQGPYCTLWLTTPFYATTRTHTPALTALCTHSGSHANATCVAHRCTCTFINYTQHTYVVRLRIRKHSTHAYTQNMYTCLC